MNTLILQLIFISKRNDLLFLFKFRRINKVCKSITEECTIDLRKMLLPNKLYYEVIFLNKVNARHFRNLRKLDCPKNMKDADLQLLPNLTYLNINRCYHITDEAIKFMKLEELYACDCKLITDRYIRNMPLLILDAGGESGITDDGIIDLRLKHLWVIGNKNITDKGLKKMYTLNELYASETNITDAGIAHLDLEYLEAIRAYYLTKEGVKHMTKCCFIRWFPQ